MKKLPVYCKEFTSIGSKVTNYRIKVGRHLANVAVIIYNGFGHLSIIYLQNFKIT